jgi:carbonic anhydrase
MKKLNLVSGIAAIAIGLASFFAAAQSNQTPVNITTVTPGGATAITSYSSMNTTYTFNLQNTTNAQFCQGTDNCALPTAQTGANAYTISNTRWGTYKLNNAVPGACAPSITYGGVQYCLLEFHFHGPSEHWVNGGATDLEVHFVFFNLADATSGPRGLCSANSLLVLGQRMVGNGNSANAAWTNVFNAIPVANASGAYSGTSLSLNIQTLMGIPGGNINAAPSYRYLGGLTAPISIATLGQANGNQSNSCVANNNPNNGQPWWGNPQNQLTNGAYPEIVQWVLFRQPIQLSVAQVNQFKAKFPDGNARSVQPNTGVTINLANPN